MGRPKPFYVREVQLAVPKEGGGVTRLACLVDDDPRLEVGKWITLTNLEDGDDRRFEILQISVPIARHAVKRGWHNNV